MSADNLPAEPRAFYCVHIDGQRYWVWRLPTWSRRIFDAIHVLRWGFMPS